MRRRQPPGEATSTAFGPLVDADWLASALGDDDLIVADVRWYLDGRPGRAAYEVGQIPGAVFVDLDRDLAASPHEGPGRHPLPTPARFAAAMSSLGIGDGDRVLAYDDAGGSVAARLWWMLRATGHDAAVLDGGLSAWPGPLEQGPGRRAPARFSAPPWPTQSVVDATVVNRARRSPSTVVLDARVPQRYRGELEPVDPRPGHVPGARNAPWAANLDPATGRFLPAEQLRERYRRLGVDGETDVIVYCGSGVTACHDLLALDLAGLGPGRLYEGSWSDWSSDPGLPAAVGDEVG